jgi:hypothetical protein
MDLLKNKNIRLGLAGLILIGLGIGIGRFSKPTSIVTKIQEKEVIKYVDKKQEKKDVKVTKKKTIKKDGEIIEEETIEDRSSTNEEVVVSSDKETKKETQVKNDIGLRLSALVLARDLTVNEYEFGIAVSKRIFGNVSLGVIATEKKAVGLTVGLDF